MTTMWIPWLMKEKSLDDFVDAEGETRLSQLMEDAGSVKPEEDLYKKELVAITRQALEELPERERLILLKRFGVMGNDEMTLEEIGKILGLSRERVRQLEKEAKMKLRERLGSLRRQLQFSLT
ncbi:MAG: sigma-70 family RNA polymerase sigma factor [Acidobacteriota bacterium]